MSKKFTIRKIYYEQKKYVGLGGLIYLMPKGTVRVDYCCNGVPIVSNVLVPYNEIKHVYGFEYEKGLLEKFKTQENIGSKDIYCFISVTLQENVQHTKTEYTVNNIIRDDVPYEDYLKLYSTKIDLGNRVIYKMYKAMYEIVKDKNINVDYVVYRKLHRITNKFDSINILDANKLIKVLSRKVKSKNDTEID